MMELIISPQMQERLENAGIRAEEVSRLMTGEGGILDPSDGTLTKGGQIGSVTLWAKVKPTESGYLLENVYCHRMTVDGVEACPDA